MQKLCQVNTKYKSIPNDSCVRALSTGSLPGVRKAVGIVECGLSGP